MSRGQKTRERCCRRKAPSNKPLLPFWRFFWSQISSLKISILMWHAFQLLFSSAQGTSAHPSLENPQLPCVCVCDAGECRRQCSGPPEITYRTGWQVTNHRARDVMWPSLLALPNSCPWGRSGSCGKCGATGKIWWHRASVFCNFFL